MSQLLIIELESRVAKRSAHGVAAREELREVDRLVLLKLRVADGKALAKNEHSLAKQQQR